MSHVSMMIRRMTSQQVEEIDLVIMVSLEDLLDGKAALSEGASASLQYNLGSGSECRSAFGNIGELEVLYQYKNWFCIVSHHQPE
jgi:hypothetical protein